MERIRAALWALMSRPLRDMRLAVMMLDGIELHGRTNIVALGITTKGDRCPGLATRYSVARLRTGSRSPAAVVASRVSARALGVPGSAW